MDSEKMKYSTTTDGKPPRPGFENAGAPAPLKENGQHEAYWVLSEEERAKGFVRPVRESYRHTGARPKYPLVDLAPDQVQMLEGAGFVKYEPYPESERPAVGRYWTEEQLKPGCGQITTMSRAIAETYARSPGYYGQTFCATCGKHLPVGKDGEFEWLDGQKVGT